MSEQNEWKSWAASALGKQKVNMAVVLNER
jgi:hypothetical protein